MNEHSAQTVATNMTLMVVTLLAATLIVVVPAWKRFLNFLDHTPSESRRAILQFSAVLIGPPVLSALAAYFSLLVSSEFWFYYLPDVFVLMVLALSLPVFLFLIPRWLLRELRLTMLISMRSCRIGGTSLLGRFLITMFLLTLGRRVWRGIRHIKTARKGNQRDPSKEAGAVGALGCFVLTILLGLFVAMAAIKVAIGVNIGGQSQQEDFEFARAMIISMLTTFSYGLACLGISYYAELRERTPGSKA